MSVLDRDMPTAGKRTWQATAPPPVASQTGARHEPPATGATTAHGNPSASSPTQPVDECRFGREREIPC